MSEGTIDYAREVAKKLLEIGAVRLSPSDPFTWTSGLRSPIYCDNRMLISHPDAYELVVDAFVEIIESDPPFSIFLAAPKNLFGL